MSISKKMRPPESFDRTEDDEDVKRDPAADASDTTEAAQPAESQAEGGVDLEAEHAARRARGMSRGIDITADAGDRGPAAADAAPSSTGTLTDAQRAEFVARRHKGEDATDILKDIHGRGAAVGPNAGGGMARSMKSPLDGDTADKPANILGSY